MFFQQNDSLDVKVSGMMILELLIILKQFSVWCDLVQTLHEILLELFKSVVAEPIEKFFV